MGFHSERCIIASSYNHTKQALFRHFKQHSTHKKGLPHQSATDKQQTLRFTQNQKKLKHNKSRILNTTTNKTKDNYSPQQEEKQKA
jgi:hypothetical protein